MRLRTAGLAFLALGLVALIVGLWLRRYDVAGFLNPTSGPLSEPVSEPAPVTSAVATYSLLPNPQPLPLNTTLTAEACSVLDYAQRTNRTGNYIQRTNNYIHESPDSCSAPFHELVNNFYARRPLTLLP